MVCLFLPEDVERDGAHMVVDQSDRQKSRVAIIVLDIFEDAESKLICLDDTGSGIRAHGEELE